MSGKTLSHAIKTLRGQPGWARMTNRDMTNALLGMLALSAQPAPDQPRYVSLDDAGPGFLRRNPDYQGEDIIEAQSAPDALRAAAKALVDHLAESDHKCDLVDKLRAALGEKP